MGFKRRREQKDFQPRLSPGEEALAKARIGIARVGEPSRFSKEGLMRGLVHDIGKVPEENWSQLLEIIKAVVFEQPHKIGYLSFIITEVNDRLGFLVVEMAQDELSVALSEQNWPRFKLFLRFLCALHPIVINTDLLVESIKNLVDKSSELAGAEASVNTAVELYKVALLASVYLPPALIDDQLRSKFANVEFAPETSDTYHCFKGNDRPYIPKTIGAALVETAVKLNEENWDHKFLAENPMEIVKLQSEKLENDSLKDVQLPDTNILKEGSVEAEISQKEEPKESAPRADDGAENEPIQDEIPKDKSEGNGVNESGTLGENNSNEQQPVAELQNSQTPNSNESSQKHSVRLIHLPEIEIISGPTDQQTYFRCYLPIDGIDTVPPESSVGGILLRDISVDIMQHMDFNRREVVKQMIVLDEFFSVSAFAPPGTSIDDILSNYSENPNKATWKIEDIALEAIFSQLFELNKLPHQKLPQVYYHSLLIEACVMAPQDIAPVLGRGLRFLFNHIETADAEVFFNAVDWFAHHVSNFAFTWKWNEWVDSLQLPHNHPKLVFIRELLGKQVRLSYPQRILDVLPAEFKEMVPNPPDVPDFKYVNDESAQRFIELLKTLNEQNNGDEQKEETNQVENATDDLKDETYEPQEVGSGFRSEELTPKVLLAKAGPNATNLLVHSICHLGSRSVTHATTWIARVEDLLTEFADDKQEIVNAVFEHWSEAPWIAPLVLKQFITTGFLTSEYVIRYIVSKGDLLLSSVGWESLKLDLDTASNVLDTVEIDGEYGTWWTERLKLAVNRIKLLKGISATIQSSEESVAVVPKNLPGSEVPENSEAGDLPTETGSGGDDVPKDDGPEEDEPAAKRQKRQTTP